MIKKSNKFLNFIKKNKLLSILMLLFILVTIFGLVMVKIIVFPSFSTDKYGDRLNGIDSVKITDTKIDEVKTTEVVEGFNIEKLELSGRIVNIYVKITGDIDKATVRDNSNKLLEKFTTEELNYYDIQIFITGESDIFPMIAYKNKKSDGLRWNYEGEN